VVEPEIKYYGSSLTSKFSNEHIYKENLRIYFFLVKRNDYATIFFGKEKRLCNNT
jgi:hypothetical protein